jgi:1-deoxy-D-xylulose-5-phosphate reductoisomerase
MKKKIAIIGSTGSIGTSLLDLVDPKKIDLILITANKNYKKLLNQAKKYKVYNIIISDLSSYKKSIIFNKDKRIKIFNNFNDLNKIIKKKLDYAMLSITGIEGLLPTFKMISLTKKIAIANKESLICAWPIIQKELKRCKTEFIPVDSEHFSIWTEIKDTDVNSIKRIYLTASGGPLLNYKSESYNNIGLKKILKHPTWKMGKKISIDSATMMNKCYEVIEAKNIFDLKYDQISLLIHPDSYVHAVVVYKNGITKMILHDTSMKIPIFNTLYTNNESFISSKKLDINKLNNLQFQKIMKKKYPIIKLLDLLPKKHSLFETVIVTINDYLVNLFLQKKINFTDISKFFFKYLKTTEFKRYSKLRPRTIYEIINLNKKLILNFSTFIKY